QPARPAGPLGRAAARTAPGALGELRQVQGDRGGLIDPLAADFAERTAALPAGAPVCVGFSGGLDSAVLLSLFAEHGEATGRKISALHVHHGLSPNADTWVRFCERFCANQGVPLTVERVRVNQDATGGVEAAARIARYAVYAARPEPFIALGHHLDDQAETVLFQLL